MHKQHGHGEYACTHHEAKQGLPSTNSEMQTSLVRKNNNGQVLKCFLYNIILAKKK